MRRTVIYQEPGECAGRRTRCYSLLCGLWAGCRRARQHEFRTTEPGRRRKKIECSRFPCPVWDDYLFHPKVGYDRPEPDFFHWSGRTKTFPRICGEGNPKHHQQRDKTTVGNNSLHRNDHCRQTALIGLHRAYRHRLLRIQDRHRYRRHRKYL